MLIGEFARAIKSMMYMPFSAKYPNKKFGLDIHIGEAVERFSKATKDEMEGEGAFPAAIPDGELELIPFKGVEIRRVLHNDEWWYSVVDVVGALVGTERSSKYWTDLKTKLVENEGFDELSDKIGKLPLPGLDGKNRHRWRATRGPDDARLR